MSRFPLLDLARDASVAVGAYVGMVRDRFWAELSNGDGFDERVAQARARMEAAADALADKEAQTEAFEPDDLWAAEASLVAAAQRTEEPRVATGPPLGTPGRVDSEVPPVSPSPSGPSLPIVKRGLGSGYPVVRGRCPNCCTARLFLGEGGFVTCAVEECQNPCAASDVLRA